MSTLEKVFLRTEHNYDRDLASQASALECKDVSRAQQHCKEECDINTIVRRFGVTGMLPTAARLPTYGDFDGVSDYHSALEALRSADEAFYDLPADVRSRFKNDPGAFVDFCSDPANLPELRSMGLAPALSDEVPPVPDSRPPESGA